MRTEPITTAAQLKTLDHETCLVGYRHGRANQPNYAMKEQAYWHGYANGQVDAGRWPKSDDQAALARDVMRTNYLMSLQ